MSRSTLASSRATPHERADERTQRVAAEHTARLRAAVERLGMDRDAVRAEIYESHGVTRWGQLNCAQLQTLADAAEVLVQIAEVATALVGIEDALTFARGVARRAGGLTCLRASSSRVQVTLRLVREGATPQRRRRVEQALARWQREEGVR